MEESKATDATAAKAPPSDGQLVEQCLAGRKEAFDELIRRYQRAAVTVSYRFLGSTHDAAEVTQDAFLKAYANLRTLEQPEAFRGWLMRIVSNLSLNYRRSRKTRRQLPLDDILGATEGGERSGGGSEWMGRDTTPAHALESKELGEKLQRALELLPEKQRMAIVLFAIQEMPQKDVAAILQCSVEAVKWHVFQGRKKLKDILKEQL
jgi:RNA polymerase sigma-70 factor (ECF subfamily)